MSFRALIGFRWLLAGFGGLVATSWLAADTLPMAQSASAAASGVTSGAVATVVALLLPPRLWVIRRS